MVQNEFDIKKIKLIVGLGNIGKNYIGTRHNAGFLFLDHLSNDAEFSEKSEFRSLIFKDSSRYLVKPTTMMNLSGEAVSLISKFYKFNPEEILVVHDDLDIILGEFKLQFNREPKEHNGIKSINGFIGKDYWRLRIGVDNRSLEERKYIEGHEYVLGRFRQEELDILNECFFSINTLLSSTS